MMTTGAIHGQPPPPRRPRPGIFLAACILAAAASPASGQQPLFDAAGRYLGSVPAAGAVPFAGRPGPVPLPAGEADGPDGTVRYGAGWYVVGDEAWRSGTPTIEGAALANLFQDGTLEYLPLKEWDLGDIESGDLNGDGLPDFVFSVSRHHCDSIPGTRPRVLIQNSAGRFVDETESRIPPLSSSTFDIDLFDADGDGDADILMCGYSCPSVTSPAVLLINDGTGVFTDESRERLIGIPEYTVISRAAEAPIDSGTSNDIIAVLLNVELGTSYPYVFLNSGDGHFWPDVYGRIPGHRPYGFYDVTASDITRDGNQDLLFHCNAYPGDGLAGGPVLFRNSGNGFFVDETEVRMGLDTSRSTRNIALADADGDGDTDILDVGWFFAANVPQVRLLLNAGDGTFAPVPGGDLASLGAWFNDVEFAPFYQDSLPDVFLAKIVVQNNSPDALLLNRGGGLFRDSSALLPSIADFTTATASVDYDRDGDLDIVIGNSSPIVDQPGLNRLYINLRRTPPAAVGEDPAAPAAAGLVGNYPNPFNPSTVIRFVLESPREVAISVTNVLGVMVARLECGRLPGGAHDVRWDASGLPAGVYWYTLTLDGVRGATRAAQLVR